MKASEALELTNKTREALKMERRPLVYEIMPRIYQQIREHATVGRRKCHLIVDEIPNSLREDAIELLNSNGYDTEWISLTQTIDNAISIIVKW